MVCKFRFLVSGRMLFVLSGTVMCTCAVMLQQWEWLVLGILLLMISFLLYLRMLRQQSEGLSLVLEAIANSDYAFRLPSRYYGDASVEIFSMAVNRMGRLLACEKQKLLVREHFYEVILQHVTTGVVVIDEDLDHVILSNEAALRLLDVPCLDRLEQLPENKQEVKACFRSLQSGENGNLSIHARLGLYQLLVRVITVVQNGRTLRIFTLNDMRNVLDENEMEAWIKLTRVLIHEIMNGMTPICSLTSSMLGKPSLTSEDLREGLSAIHATSQGVLTFVENYRRFTSLPKPHPDILVVRELLNEVEALQLLPEHIQLTVQVCPKDIMLYADRHLIRQVFINLLRNATQAIGEAVGRIDISVSLARNEHVYVYVSNDGPKITDEEAERLFVPFYTTKRGGSGIGLSVSRQIMVQSNGNITLLPPGTRGWNTTFLMEFY